METPRPNRLGFSDLHDFRSRLRLDLRCLSVWRARQRTNFNEFSTASLTDPLTGVTNRRGFFEIGERHLERARLGNEPIAIVMFDLDRFKTINDQFGHAIGDEVLIAFCRLASAQLRPKDLFARIGGEEFVTLLPNTTTQDALRLAERVRSAIEGASHTVEDHLVRMTVSVGVASPTEGTTALDVLVSAADNALYRAKTAGRNRVELTSSILDCIPRRNSDVATVKSRSAP
jgi:diguanylate cyclase (GGDEF)-like protein